MLLILMWMGCHHSPSLTNVNVYEECPTEAPVYGQIQQVMAPLLEEKPGLTGTLVLEDGSGALTLRAWLIEQAQFTIDVQYFIFSADNVGLLSTAALLQAANRGVKVRILLDDILAHGDDQVLLAIHQHPNIEVKIFNPNINIGKTFRQKSRNILFKFDEINQRMHNKSLLIDKQYAITGGRNVGDEYYDLNSHYNFRDRDVALFGNSAGPIQESFELFWEDDHSIFISNLLPYPTDASVIQDNLRNYRCSPERFVPAFRARINQTPSRLQIANQDGVLHWIDSIQYITDAPWKNESKGLGGGGISTAALIDLLHEAQERIWIQTPYLVLTEVGLSALKQALDRNVEIKILTNSLAATDNYAAFSGYQKVRNRLVEMGVQVYELKPDAPDVQSLNTSGIPIKMNADVGLHAKSMLIDNHIAVIGTFNMDPRSANLNTESIVIIRDTNINQEMTLYFAREMNSVNSWSASKSNDREASLKRRILTWISKLVPSALL